MTVPDSSRLRVVVVGHVDHGKSTLIGRLLLDTGSVSEDRLEEIRSDRNRQGEPDPAFVTDSLDEERARSITIDTAQVFLRTPLRGYAVIDTPGHKQFLKNMFTGATRADAAILVVDVAEGVCEQTVRHSEILRMLGVRQTIVAVNKMDAVGFDASRFEALSRELRELIGRGPAGRDEIEALLPVSAREGDNVARRSERTEWYSGPTLLGALENLSVRAETAGLPLRMPVQDVYEVGGRRVSVGRIASGRIGAGDHTVFQPSGRSCVVQSLRRSGRSGIREAKAGESVGLSLTDGHAATRGEVLCHQGSPVPVTCRVEGLVFWLAERPLAKGASLILRCATQEVGCRADVIAGRQLLSPATPVADPHELREGELGDVVLATDRPIAVERFADIPQLGRFALVDGAGIVGAGVVTSWKPNAADNGARG